MKLFDLSRNSILFILVFLFPMPDAILDCAPVQVAASLAPPHFAIS